MRLLPREYDEKLVEHLRCIVVPSGIGEFQWSWTKFHNTGERFAVFALDGAPRRLHQFCELHPAIEAFGWIGFDYTQIRQFQKMFKLDTWGSVAKQFGFGQRVMLACNPHLEAGRPLAEWLPDLKTTYSYPYELRPEHFTAADITMANREPQDFVIGISCASYRGAAAWKTWMDREWTELLHMISRDFPNIKFMMLGGSWDDVTSTVFNPDGPLPFLLDKRGRAPIGTMSFGGTVATLQRTDAYIGFSSGLGHVASHLCNVPVFMLWPEHEQLLSRSWVNPELLDSGHYVPSRWLAPEEVYKSVKPWLMRHYLRKAA